MATERLCGTVERPTHRREDNGGKWPGSSALKEILEGIERDLIVAALKETHGNKAKAARALCITERFMGLRVNRLGIDWREFRPRRRQSAARSA